MLKTRITNELILDETIDTNILVGASTYQNISFDKLTKKLSLLNAQINRRLFRYYLKYPDRRIVFYCNHEKIENNTHSHIIIKIPPMYDKVKVMFLMKELWKKLDDRVQPKFKLYVDFNVKNEFANVRYAFKRFNQDTFIVI